MTVFRVPNTALGACHDRQRADILTGLHVHPSIAGDGMDGDRHNERRLRGLLAATSDVIYRMSPDWTLMYQLDGRGFMPDTNTPSVAWQEDYLLAEERPTIMAVVADAIRNRSVFEFEHRIRLADGSIGWTFSRAIPIMDDRGEIVEWFGAASDITDRKRGEELTKLLTLEVHHRLKNTLGMVQAIANGTFKSEAASEELKIFDARLRALASAQDVLIRSEWDSADVHEVVSRALQAMPDSRLVLDGPAATIGPSEAQGLALVVHELCTNASKYGAFAIGDGRVTVQWSIEGSLLKLEWRESGGKPVSPPTHKGFGSRILQGVIRREAGGSVELDYAPDGLICRIRLPLVNPK
ncbi:MAG: sensor histidine kinase [Janthinobacterium lividum]